MTFDLARMIAPLEPDAFFGEYWEKRPLVLSGRAADYYSSLCTLADVDRILSSTDLRYPALRLIRNGPDLPPEAYTQDLRSRRFVFTGACDTERVLAEYQRGATILLQRVERSWAPLADLCRNLEALFYHPVDANVYLTPRSAQGFTAHYDAHDVFILQVAGSKHWRLYDAPLRLPLESQPHTATGVQFGACTHECDVQPGDLIYLPRGTGHEALTSDSSSLHITVGITPHTWADVLVDAVMAAARHDVRLRESVPLALDSPGTAKAVPYVRAPGTAKAVPYVSGRAVPSIRDLLAAVSETVRVDDLLDAMRERFIATRRPLLAGQLTQIDELQHLGAETMLARRPGVIFRLLSTENAVTLAFHQKKITYPLHLEPTLRYIATAEPFQVGSIPNLKPLERMLLAQRLVREGFLVLCAPDTPDDARRVTTGSAPGSL